MGTHPKTHRGGVSVRLSRRHLLRHIPVHEGQQVADTLPPKKMGKTMRPGLVFAIACLAWTYGSARAFVVNPSLARSVAGGGSQDICQPAVAGSSLCQRNSGRLSLRMTGGTSETPAEVDTGKLQPAAVLRLLMSMRSKEADKKVVVDKMMAMRQENAEDLQALLDGMLAEMDDVRPFFRSLKSPFPLPSYRAKLGALSRMMTTVMDGETEPRRRRSAMAQLMRQLSTSPRGVWGLEREMVSRTKRQTTMKEMLDRTPQDLETPKYSVEKEYGDWEVREYKKFSVVSTEMQGAVSPGSFNSLAKYIFGSNKEGVKMAMTTPVINKGGSKMSFIMPSDYWEDTSKSPTPMTGDVTIEDSDMVADSSTVAVMWFGGYASKDEVEKRKKALMSVVESNDEWELVDASGDPYLLQYNDPFQPPWKRRNEVVAAVKRCKVPASAT